MFINELMKWSSKSVIGLFYDYASKIWIYNRLIEVQVIECLLMSWWNDQVSQLLGLIGDYTS